MEIIEDITTKNLDHLGLVAGVCDEIGLVELIDRLTGSNEQRKISVGIATKAMVLNGLGFANQTLYLTPEFFDKKPVDILLGEGILAKDINSHSLGTALDELYYSGISKVFYNVSLQSITRYGIKITSRHLDGTTFTVHGEKLNEKGAKSGLIELKRGYNKQKRHDLPQFVFELISSNVEGIPLFIKAASGNKTDKTEFPEVLEAYMAQMKGREKLEGHMVADSALYSAENLGKIESILWISRVPETITRAKNSIKRTAGQEWKKFKDMPGYKYQEIKNSYGGIEQRWFIIYSSASAQRSEKTVEKWVLKNKAELEKGGKKLGKESYLTEALAKQAVTQWYKSLKKSVKRYHDLGAIEIAKKEHYGRGRRKQDAEPQRISYNIQSIDFQRDEVAIAEHKYEKSQFILATNDLDAENLTAEQALHLYKNEQQKVERGFRFLKDPMFLLDKIFLELPRRIMALSMVMALCLLVYTLAQFKIRKALKESKKTLPNQLKRPIQNPTMKWIFQLLGGIHVMYIKGEKKYILNLNETRLKILNLMGEATQSYYTV